MSETKFRHANGVKCWLPAEPDDGCEYECYCGLIWRFDAHDNGWQCIGEIEEVGDDQT